MSDIILRVTVRVTVTDPRVYARVTGEDGDEFRANLYPSMRTIQDVNEHLAKACLDGFDDASDLDGWADLPRGAATMLPIEAEVER
jgi:hypothetical protein